MRCEYCGTKLFPADRLCPSCGANPPDEVKPFHHYGMMSLNEIRQEMNLPTVVYYRDAQIVGIGGAGGGGGNGFIVKAPDPKPESAFEKTKNYISDNFSFG